MFHTFTWTWYVQLSSGKHTTFDWLMPFRGSTLSIFTMQRIYTDTITCIRRSERASELWVLNLCVFRCSVHFCIFISNRVLNAAAAVMVVVVRNNKIQTIWICFNSRLTLATSSQRTFCRTFRACFYVLSLFALCILAIRLFTIRYARAAATNVFHLRDSAME